MNKEKQRNGARLPKMWSPQATCVKPLVVLMCCCPGLWLGCLLTSRDLVPLQEAVFPGVHHSVVSLAFLWCATLLGQWGLQLETEIRKSVCAVGGKIQVIHRSHEGDCLPCFCAKPPCWRRTHGTTVPYRSSNSFMWTWKIDVYGLNGQQVMVRRGNTRADTHISAGLAG